ncbi:MAG: ATP-binding protein [Candidatus Marinimicrobia bacterium]|nr:ATP-binding protein [Candidatus Neomarinimicrobiota bacterium]
MTILPESKTPPVKNMERQTILLYAHAKFGKSTIAAGSPNAIFLATEAGLNHLNVYQTPIQTWEDLLMAAKEIAEAKHSFKTVVIDTVDNAYRLCSEYICAQHNIKHESDLGYGKGWSLVNGEFQRVLTKLSLLPYGLFLISHAVEKEIETRTGNYTRIIPTLPDKARKIILGMSDFILYGDMDSSVVQDGKTVERRVLRTKPTKHYVAGDRTGKLPETIEATYDAFLKVYERSIINPQTINKKVKS